MILPLFQVASAYPTASSAIPQKHSLAGNSVPRQSRKRHLGRKSRYVSLALVLAWQRSDRGLEGLLFAGTRLAARSHLLSRTSSLSPLRDGLGRERDVTELRPPRCSWGLSKHETELLQIFRSTSICTYLLSLFLGWLIALLLNTIFLPFVPPLSCIVLLHSFSLNFLVCRIVGINLSNRSIVTT